MNIGEKLKELRIENNLNQSQVAEILGTSRVNYCRYEGNKHFIPMEFLIKLARHYDVSLDYICGLEN